MTETPQRRIDDRNFSTMVRMWWTAGIVWFCTTIICAAFQVHAVSKWSGSLHEEHMILLEMKKTEIQNAIDRDIEQRKRLIILQDRLEKLEKHQLENKQVVDALLIRRQEKP